MHAGHAHSPSHERPAWGDVRKLGDEPIPVVAVSDEIGLGMVPMDAYARAFRDLQGIVHQRFATAATR